LHHIYLLQFTRMLQHWGLFILLLFTAVFFYSVEIPQHRPILKRQHTEGMSINTIKTNP